MTDPRIVECAKAALDADAKRRGNEYGTSEYIWHSGTAVKWENIALAAILKWLEQPASAGMVEAGFNGDPLSCDVGHAEDVYPPTYAAMCAAAKQEISGG